MSVDRLTRLNELLKRELAGALFRVMQNEPFDLSAVTITRVVLSRDLREARVCVSIREHHAERNKMLSMLRHHRQEFQKMLNRDLVMKYTPRLSFELDTSVEEGDHVLALLNKMAEEEQTRRK
jgi:ribosome-binding factor A